MGVSRIILKKGDVFRIEITRNQVFYIQYVANDVNQLNGDVIRVFTKRYTAEDNPLIEHIVSGEINFYCHVFLKRGVQLGYWTKYGHSNIWGSLKNIFFKGFMINKPWKGNLFAPWEDFWAVWGLDGECLEYKKLPVEYYSAYYGPLLQPNNVIKKLVTGRFVNYKDIAEDDFSTEIHQRIDISFNKLCTELGFEECRYNVACQWKSYDVYYKRITDECLVTLSFPCTSDKQRGSVFVSCLVGIVNMRLYNVYERYAQVSISCKNTDLYTVPDEILLTQIGYLMPENELKEWKIDEGSDMTLIFSRIKDSIINYVYPFVIRYSDYDNLVEAVVNNDYYSRIDNYILKAIISYLKGDKLKSIEFLNAKFKDAPYMSKEYESFNESFRKLLL